MPTLAEDQATIAALRGLLNGAAKSIYENGRRMEFDLSVAQSQLAAAEARVAAAQGERPQVRRVSFVQYGKGL